MKKLVLPVLFLPLMALAQGNDPTRPPASWLSPDNAASVENAGGPRLQSVLLPEKGRPLAIISGKNVPLGGEFEGARLVSIQEHVVILRGPEGITRLYLTPEVEKKMTEQPKANVPGAVRKKEKP